MFTAEKAAFLEMNKSFDVPSYGQELFSGCVATEQNTRA